MLSPQALIKGIVSRVLPAPVQDGQESERPVRLDRYGALYVQTEVPKMHTLSDEGSYFVVNNAQTAIADGKAIAFVATTPTLLLANNDSPSNPNGKRIYIDYIDLTVSTAGVTATALTASWVALVTDQGNRYNGSSGTDMSAKIVSSNQDNPLRSSIAQTVFGAITATAATATARTIVGQRMTRLPAVALTGPNLLGDRVRLEFGGVEVESVASLGTGPAVQANPIQQTIKFPPVIVGPGQSLLVYTWAQATTYSTATSYFPEIGWWER
jgi:hypothetical protein